jgi:hypothetical protein
VAQGASDAAKKALEAAAQAVKDAAGKALGAAASAVTAKKHADRAKEHADRAELAGKNGGKSMPPTGASLAHMIGRIENELHRLRQSGAQHSQVALTPNTEGLSPREEELRILEEKLISYGYTSADVSSVENLSGKVESSAHARVHGTEPAATALPPTSPSTPLKAGDGKAGEGKAGAGKAAAAGQVVGKAGPIGGKEGGRWAGVAFRGCVVCV